MSFLSEVTSKYEVLSDFTSAKKAFLNQGIESSAIEDYFKKFKESKERGKIKTQEQKNIDTWAKTPWKSFQTFVDSLTKSYTQTELKQKPWLAKSIPGASRVAGNNKWVVFLISSFEAAKKLGDRSWCICRHKETWDDYARGKEPDILPSIFYFILDTTSMYKFCVQSTNKDVSIWGASNEEFPYDEKFAKREGFPKFVINKPKI